MTAGPAPVLGWCPFPGQAVAETVVNALLDEGLIACANIVPGMRSLYLWNGERGIADEAGVLFKLNDTQLEHFMVRLEELHPYDEPAILAWRCDAASPDTIRWLAGPASFPPPAEG